MTTIFMNSKNSITFDPHKLLLNLSDKTDLKRSDKYVALSNLSIYYTWKNRNYLMGHFLYQIFKIILIISSKNTKQ